MSGLRARWIAVFFLPITVACSGSDGDGSDTPGAGGAISPSSGGALAGGSGNATSTGGAMGGGGAGGVSAGSGGNAVGGASAGTGGGGVGGCSPYPLDAPDVTGTAESGAAPVMTGGQIVDGKYWLTAMKEYGTGSPNRVAERIDISGAGTYFDDVARENGSELRNGTSMTVNGPTVTFRIACGLYQGTTGAAQYSATPTDFTILLQNGELKVYARQ